MQTDSVQDMIVHTMIGSDLSWVQPSGNGVRVVSRERIVLKRLQLAEGVVDVAVTCFICSDLQRAIRQILMPARNICCSSPGRK